MTFPADEAGSVLDWIGQNKEWLFSGVGVAVFLGILAIIRWMRPRRAQPGPPSPQQTADQIGEDNTSAQAANRSQAISIGTLNVHTAPSTTAPAQVEPTEAEATPVAGRYWPGQYIRPGLPVMADPFCGRKHELKQLQKAFKAGKSVVCIVGPGGQGKSSILGQWRKTRRKALAEKALFWCRPYDAGYTFATFLADVLPYLTGGEYDPREYLTTKAQAELLCQLLAKNATVIVLDGVERWLAKWKVDPDATGEGASADERKGGEEGLDLLLESAAGWTNGSALIMTTRALPSALDGRPVARIGAGARRDEALKGLADDSAVELLKELGVTGEDEDILAAANEYDNHPLALAVLGGLLAKQFGGDVTKRPQVDVVADDPTGRLAKLLGEVAEHHKDNLLLLGIIACCLGSAPLEMLVEITKEDGRKVRVRLAELQDWHLAKFNGESVELHALIRKYFLGALGEERVKTVRQAIATWFALRPIPDEPRTLEDVRSLVLGARHALAADDAGLAMDFLHGTAAGRHYPTLSGWMDAFGHMALMVELYGGFIAIYEDLVRNQGRKELRKNLGLSYNNRGLALWRQGDPAAAVEDYDKAIDIYETLVEGEGRPELRNELAASYNNRGLALEARGDLAAAVENYNKAIEIRETLVRDEGRLELRNDLAMSYNNRAGALAADGEHEAALADAANAVSLYGTLVRDEGRSDLVGELAMSLGMRGDVLRQSARDEQAWASFREAFELLQGALAAGRVDLLRLLLPVAGDVAGIGVKLERAGEAAECVGKAAGFLQAAADAGQVTELLESKAGVFFPRVLEHAQPLAEAGLDLEALVKLGRQLGIIQEKGQSTDDSPDDDPPEPA